MYDFKFCMGKNTVFQYNVSTKEGKIKKSIKNPVSFVQ